MSRADDGEERKRAPSTAVSEKRITENPRGNRTLTRLEPRRKKCHGMEEKVSSKDFSACAVHLAYARRFILTHKTQARRGRRCSSGHVLTLFVALEKRRLTHRHNRLIMVPSPPASRLGRSIVLVLCL